MKSMKSLIACILVATLLLTSCTAAPSKPTLNPKEPIVVTVWSYYNSKQKDILDGFVQRFNDGIGASLGVIVDHISYGTVTELSRALLASARDEGGAEKMPDMFILYKGVAREVEMHRPLVDLHEWFTDEEQSAFLDAFVAAGRYTASDEAMKMFPIGKSTELLLVNDTLFSKYVDLGVFQYSDLSTYEGLLKAAEAYYRYTDAQTAQDGDGKALYGLDSVENYVFVSLAGLGKDLIRLESGEEVVSLDKEAMRLLWDHYIVPFIRGYYSHRAKFASEDIKTGSVLVSQSSTSSSSYFPTIVIDANGLETPIRAKVLPIPRFAAGESKLLLQGGGMFVVNSTPERVLASIEFLKWLTNTENNLDFATQCSYLPVRKDNFNLESIEQAAASGAIKEATKLVMTTAMQLFEEQTPYEPDPTEHYEQIRRLLGVYFREYSANTRLLVEEQIKNGVRYDAAVAKQISGERFEAWYELLERDIQAILNE